MAFDPIQEDCMRLILAAMRREGIRPLEAPAYVERAAATYRINPSSMIMTDADRSFHLVAKATETIDYRIPFIADEHEADAEAQVAEGNLREAAELDPCNWDAQRMVAAIDAKSNDEYVAYLEDGLDRVEADARRLASAQNDLDASPGGDSSEAEAIQDLGQRPYLRWLAALAEHQFICGRYKKSLETVEACLERDPQDLAGARHTGMLALAKLEVPLAELDAFRAKHAASYESAAGIPAMRTTRGRRGRTSLDAWTLIARMNLGYRSFDERAATEALEELLESYPNAAQALYYQAEFPEGLFGRVAVAPGSEDELILAISEATPLFQEGIGSPEATSFAIWVSDHELVRRGLSPFGTQSRMRGRGGAN